jgi:hypothetical protein
MAADIKNIAVMLMRNGEIVRVDFKNKFPERKVLFNSLNFQMVHTFLNRDTKIRWITYEEVANEY